MLWVCSDYDVQTQAIRFVVWTDLLDDSGIVTERRYRSLSFSWIQPDETRALLQEIGFEIEAVYGDFDRRPLDQSSPEQIWIARRRR
ncbi:MAG: hypothetical protein LC772_06020 [Chloroflexi bacterium]|nr:hypothetical protein [Chloroflexota bacterium]